MMPAQEPSSDRVAKLAASPFHERIPHPAGATLDGSAVIAMFRTNQIRADDTMYVLVTEDDGRVTTSWQRMNAMPAITTVSTDRGGGRQRGLHRPSGPLPTASTRTLRRLRSTSIVPVVAATAVGGPSKQTS